MGNGLIFRLEANYNMQMVLMEDQVIFFTSVPDRYGIFILLGFGVIFLITSAPLFSGASLFDYSTQNEFFPFVLVAIWAGILMLAIFGPILWERKRISKMKTEDFGHLVKKRIEGKRAIKRSWHQIVNATPVGESRFEFLIEEEVKSINAKLKQVYSQDVSTAPPQLQLRDFLMEKLGARLQVVG